MADVSKKYQDQLERIKKNVHMTHDYWSSNYKRFNEFKKMVFKTSVTDDDKNVLASLGKPDIEFNILEPYISRLLGEYAKQEPSIYVSPEDGAEVDQFTLKLLEAHLRHILFESNKNGANYHAYKDCLSGGFSVFKVWTEWAHSKSFNQVIKYDRVSDPTMVGFDPLARQSTKSDARFCFECYPMDKEQFKNDYPDVSIESLSFIREFEGFNWSFSIQGLDVLILCDYYEKKKKKIKIVQLVDGRVMTMDEYKDFIENWFAEGRIEQPPAIKGKPRNSEIEKICRYKVLGNQVLEYEETNYRYLPYVFVDGNSIWLRESNEGALKQMTRPYVYNATGAQRLKNFAGQTLGAELENLVQHKFKVAIESLPDEGPYLSAYTNVQVADTLMYNAFSEENPNQALPPPQEIVRAPIPAEVSNTFSMTDTMVQNSLGSFDAAAGNAMNRDLSGKAVIESATLSNAAAMPYIVSFLEGLTQLGTIIIDLIPKYYVSPMTIPVVAPDGKKLFIPINKPGQVNFNYSENDLSVKVEAGANFRIEKARSLQQVVDLARAIPSFGEFINAKGLSYVLDSLEISGVDSLKELAKQWQQEQAQAREQAMQQPNPEQMKIQLEQAKLQQKAQNDLMINQQKIGELQMAQQKNDIELAKLMTQQQTEQTKAQIAVVKADAEKLSKAIELMIAKEHQDHSHSMDIVRHHHEMDKHRHQVNIDNKKVITTEAKYLN